MRRILTWGLVAAVAALGLAAGIDALRGGEEPEPVAATAEETVAPEPGTDLERAGVPAGRLVYSDEDCGVHALELPGLAERPVHDLVACQSEGASFSQPGGVRAECDGGQLRIWAGPLGDPELVARERGCGAAWKPDRTVTFVQDGGIRRFAPCPGDPELAPLRCSKPVLTRAQLARQLRSRASGVGPRITEHAWLDDERFAAVVRSSLDDLVIDQLALFDRGRLVGDLIGPYEDLGGLKATPTGGRVAAFDRERGAVVALDGAGRQIQLPLEEGTGLAWSPDEQWIAVATEDGIYVWRADDDSPEPIHIPVVARDLLWSGPAAEADATLAEARAALRAAGVPRGRLVYADGDCRNHTLELPDLTEPSPFGYEGLCRYRAVAGGLVETAGPPR